MPNFASITAFHRALDDARFAFGFDLPTFNSGGIAVTTGAWTGTCTGPRIEAPPPPPGPPSALPEPASVTLLVGGLALGAARRGLSRSRQKPRQDLAGV